MVKLIKKVYHMFRTGCFTVMSIPKAVKKGFEESYYPELTRKRGGIRVLDNIRWLLRYHEVNSFYSLYGMDVLERDDLIAGYKDYRSFMTERNNKNNIDSLSSQVVLLRDKYLFFKYLSGLAIPVAGVFACYIKDNDSLYDENMNPVEESAICNEKDYFIKELNGECASFVIHIADYIDYQEKKESIVLHDCLFQHRLIQCKELNRLNPNAVNTIRIVTINNDGYISVLAAELRIGTKLTGVVDNAAAGGIVVGIDETGHLNEYGLCKYGATKRVRSHPDTGLAFKGFTIPNYDEVCKLACDAHSKLYRIHSIGWDIAITESGPVLIEGNDNWEISGLQAANGGLRKKWEKACM